MTDGGGHRVNLGQVWYYVGCKYDYSLCPGPCHSGRARRAVGSSHFCKPRYYSCGLYSFGCLYKISVSCDIISCDWGRGELILFKQAYNIGKCSGKTQCTFAEIEIKFLLILNTNINGTYKVELRFLPYTGCTIHFSSNFGPLSYKLVASWPVP